MDSPTLRSKGKLQKAQEVLQQSFHSPFSEWLCGVLRNHTELTLSLAVISDTVKCYTIWVKGSGSAHSLGSHILSFHAVPNCERETE